jgi:hypothetical protein
MLVTVIPEGATQLMVHGAVTKVTGADQVLVADEEQTVCTETS